MRINGGFYATQVHSRSLRSLRSFVRSPEPHLGIGHDDVKRIAVQMVTALEESGRRFFARKETVSDVLVGAAVDAHGIARLPRFCTCAILS